MQRRCTRSNHVYTRIRISVEPAYSRCITTRQLAQTFADKHHMHQTNDGMTLLINLTQIRGLLLSLGSPDSWLVIVAACGTILTRLVGYPGPQSRIDVYIRQRSSHCNRHRNHPFSPSSIMNAEDLLAFKELDKSERLEEAKVSHTIINKHILGIYTEFSGSCLLSMPTTTS